jgi:hypothetical protein
MTQKQWIAHMPANYCSLTKAERLEILKQHHENECPDCKARSKTKKATAKRKEKDSIMESLGLIKVRSVSGKIYYE